MISENALAYGGERQLQAENLYPAPTESYYHGKEKLHNQFADVSAYLVENGIIKMQFLIGNETELEKHQVLRKASYQGGACPDRRQSIYGTGGGIIKEAEGRRESTYE